jgi:adenylate kinase family enzyme
MTEIYIVNLFGGPGAGKSTTAAGLFAKLKLNKIETELVTEYAKDAVYEQRNQTLKNQFYISAKQHHRLWRVIEYWKTRGVEKGFIVTDSPLVLGLMYLQNSKTEKQFKDFLLAEYNSFRNINIFINRVKEYNPNGRMQTENEAKEIDRKIKSFLDNNKIDYVIFDGNETAPNEIFNYLKQNYIKDWK